MPSGFSTGVQTHAENWRGKVTDSGSGYAARNERWFLHTRKGRRFTFRSYDWLWAANIADRSYQRRWTTNALRLLAARPEFDGLFIDDVNPTIHYYHDPADVRELNTDEAYAEATGKALAAIAPRVRAQGWLVYANLGAWTDFGDEVRPWLRHLDGAMDEQWVKFGTRRGAGYRDEVGWARQVANVADASAAGVHVMTISHSDDSDAAAARYGYASALLASRGGWRSPRSATTTPRHGSRTTSMTSARRRARCKRRTEACGRGRSSVGWCWSTRRRARSGRRPARLYARTRR